MDISIENCNCRVQRISALSLVFIFLVYRISSVCLIIGDDYSLIDIAGVIVFIRLFWLVGIAGVLQTLIIVFICSSCVSDNVSYWMFKCSSIDFSRLYLQQYQWQQLRQMELSQRVELIL